MSCFMVNPRTLARMANYICAHINNGYNCTHITLKVSDEFKELVSNKGIASEEKVYQELYRLNYKAYKTRYEGRHPADMDDLDKFAEYDNPPVGMYSSKINENHYQMLKSMECYLYQCAESDELENSIIYNEIRHFKNAIMNKIVHSLPAYDAADWD